MSASATTGAAAEAAIAAVETYESARVLSAEHTAEPKGREYQQGAFFPHYAKQHSKTLQACFRDLPSPDRSPFAFVAVLAADGRIERVYLDHETNVAACLRTALLADRAPAPPFAGFHVAVDMNLK